MLVVDVTRPPNGSDECESNRLSYWLRLIQHYGRSLKADTDTAPVIILFTHCDIGEVDEHGQPAGLWKKNLDALHHILDERFDSRPPIVSGVGWNDQLKTELKTTSGKRRLEVEQIWQRHCDAVDKLRTTIESNIHKIPGMDLRLDPTYFAVRDWITHTFSKTQIEGDGREVKHFNYQTSEAFKRLLTEENIDEDLCRAWLKILRTPEHFIG